jgi:aminomethyltransferase
MPVVGCQVSYGAEGIAASHLHTRQHCSVFDVSHMMQTEVRGRDRLPFLESLTTADLINMRDNTSTLTVFTDPITGGILDDLIITKTPLGYYQLVSNATRRSQDQKLLQEAQVRITLPHRLRPFANACGPKSRVLFPPCLAGP